MKKNEITDLLEKEDFIVHIFEQENETCAEIETWTERGVNMIIELSPFTVENFSEYVKNFDVDKEIDAHRESDRYRKDFTISQALKDFNGFKRRLKKTLKALTS